MQVVAGYNASVFAYGQTASGKTHTIFGDHAASQGILAHAMNHIFAATSSSNQGSASSSSSSPPPNQNSSDALTVSISVVQIYNEQISDLLWEPPPGTKRNGAVFCKCHLLCSYHFLSDCCLRVCSIFASESCLCISVALKSVSWPLLWFNLQRWRPPC